MSESKSQFRFTNLGDHPLLTQTEEKALGKAIQGKNKAKAKRATDTLTAHNLRLAIKIATDFFPPDYPNMDDVIAEGCLGLYKAAQRFDPNKGAKFSTFAAWWIKQTIMRYVANNSRTIRIPLHMRDKLRTLSRIKASMSVELTREPTDEEIIEATNMSQSSLDRLALFDVKTISLDTPLNEEGDRFTLQDIIPDTGNISPDDSVQSALDVEQIKRLLNFLTPREQRIIKGRYGINQSEPMTLEEVGQELGITRERVRQIQEKALIKLKKKASKNAYTDAIKKLKLKKCR